MARRLTKQDLATSLHAAGRTIEEIGHALHCEPGTVATLLGQEAPQDDLYTSSIAQNHYARLFNGILRFKDLEAAQQSVARLDALYHQFVETGDRRGQHQAQLMALIGKSRAESIGKQEEARLFLDWLVNHLDITEVG